MAMAIDRVAPTTMGVKPRQPVVDERRSPLADEAVTVTRQW
jgi:hypothetical protein